MRSSRRPAVAVLLAAVTSALVAVLGVGAPATGVAPTPTPSWPGPVPTPCPSRSPVPAPEPTSSAGPVPLATPRACIPLGTSTLGGRVSDEGGTPVQGVTVRVLGTTGGEETVHTDDGGWWAVGSLPGGSYRISFTAWQQGFVSEWWDDAPDSVTAAVATLAEGDSVRDLQTRLARTATLSGRVVAPDGQVPAGTVVMVDDATASGTHGYAPVGADGTYQADGLDPGSYIIRAVPGAGSSWGTTYYPDVRGPATATPVTVAASQRLDGLDVTLQANLGISGTVTLPPGTDASQVRVVATPLGDARLWVRAADVAADGTYRLADVFPGSYTVRVEDAGADPPIATRYYPDSATAGGALPVVVVDGADTTGIDILFGDTPTPSPTRSGCTATVSVVSAWQGAYQATVTVTAGSSAITGWKATVDGATITQAWNGTASGSTITSAAWNGALAAGGTTSAGFLGSGSPSGLTATCTPT